MGKNEKNFLAKAKSWTSKHNLHGPHAFRRFVMLVFVDRLNKHCSEFILKGGNLLWVYINTPRDKPFELAHWDLGGGEGQPS